MCNFLSRITLSLSLFVLVCAVEAVAQPHAQLPLEPVLPTPGVTYNPAVPTPEQVIGHRIGTHHTRPDQVVAYVRAVAEASPYVTYSVYGMSHERRPLVQAVITAEANHARLEDIRQANLRLSDAPQTVTDGQLSEMPSVVWMGYGIHGNESSAMEAALLTLYYLAAGQGPEVDEMRRRLVVVLDPNYNPDGHERFTGWVNRHRGAVAVADPQDMEARESWPGGRTNKYWFDLNRDWLPLVHPESQARIREFHRWRPQLLTDFHEMGGEATYFFQPGVPSRTNPNTPALNQEMTARVAEYHARAFDQIGSLYYTREQFDDFYYGKGSTFPDANGTVGILYEQGSSRGMLAQTRTHGVLTYGFTIRNQVAASISALQAAVGLRTDLLRMQREFYASASAFARQTGVGAYVFGDAGDPTRAAMLVRLLNAHRINVHRLAQPVTAEGHTFAPGNAYVIPLDQPQARLIQGIMERPLTFTDSLFYDISAWTLPLAFGLPMAALSPQQARVAGDVLPPTFTLPEGQVQGTATYAYAISWGRFHAPRALYALQQRGIRVRTSMQPFQARVNGQVQTFPRGTLLVSLGLQDVSAETIHAMMPELARQHGVDVSPLDVGFSVMGPDLGSSDFPVLPPVRVALITGAGTASAPAGEIWHTLGERFGMPVSLLNASDVGNFDLSRYTVLILAGGTYPEAASRNIVQWVRRGGHLIATGGAAGWAVQQELVSLTTREGPSDERLRSVPFADLAATRGAQAVGGSLFRARLDTTHPIAFGLPAELTFFRASATFYEPSTVPGTNVATYTESPLVAGYLSSQRQSQASGVAAVVAQRAGAGRVVVIPDNPTFRGFFLGTTALFMNAVFLSSTF